MTDAPDDRPILSAYGVKDGDRIVSIHLERGPAEALTHPTSTPQPARRRNLDSREESAWRDPTLTLAGARSLSVASPKPSRSARRFSGSTVEPAPLASHIDAHQLVRRPLALFRLLVMCRISWIPRLPFGPP